MRFGRTTGRVYILTNRRFVVSASGALSSTGTASVSWVSASTRASVLSSTGVSTVKWRSGSTFKSTGTSTVSWVGGRQAGGALNSTGTATVSWSSAKRAAAAMSSLGQALVSFFGTGGTPAVNKGAERPNHPKNTRHPKRFRNYF